MLLPWATATNTAGDQIQELLFWISKLENILLLLHRVVCRAIAVPDLVSQLVIRFSQLIQVIVWVNV